MSQNQQGTSIGRAAHGTIARRLMKQDWEKEGDYYVWKEAILPFPDQHSFETSPAFSTIETYRNFFSFMEENHGFSHCPSEQRVKVERDEHGQLSARFRMNFREHEILERFAAIWRQKAWDAQVEYEEQLEEGRRMQRREAARNLARARGVQRAHSS